MSVTPPTPPARSGGTAPAARLMRAAGVVAGLTGLSVAPAGCDRVTPPPPSVAQGAAPSAGYPDLRDVPPRPRLAQSAAQREALADALARERAWARYTNRLVRHRAGLSDVPPGSPPPGPPPAPVAAAPAVVEPEAAPAAAAEMDLEPPTTPFEELPGESDEGDLDSFIRGLVRDTEAFAPSSPTEPEEGAPPDAGGAGGA